VDFFDPAALAQQVIALCDNPAERARLAAQARAFAVEHYHLETQCLPKQIEWVKRLADSYSC
jgi:glycosyltransferase involved in cell wall biosynthesis